MKEKCVIPTVVKPRSAVNETTRSHRCWVYASASDNDWSKLSFSACLMSHTALAGSEMPSYDQPPFEGGCPEVHRWMLCRPAWKFSFNHLLWSFDFFICFLLLCSWVSTAAESLKRTITPIGRPMPSFFIGNHFISSQGPQDWNSKNSMVRYAVT